MPSLTLALTFALPLLLPAQTFYTYRPKPLPDFQPPNRPLVKLAGPKHKHPAAPWAEVAFRDQHLHGEYIAARPGDETPPAFHPDTRIFWVIFEGEIQFTIEGRPPVIAKPGSLVQVPKQNIYSMKTLGAQPSVRLEVTIPGATTVFVSRPSLAGGELLEVRPTYRTAEPYGKNRVHANIHELIANDPKYGDEFFVEGDNAIAHIVCAFEKNVPPFVKGDRGHFHPEGAEVFINLMGQNRIDLEGQGMIHQQTVGDVTYIPRFTFHNGKPFGEERSCRLVLSAYREVLLQLRDPIE